jgi:cytochrome b561
VIFVVIFISGIGLNIAPSGRTAREIGWNFLGFDKESLEMIHTLCGYLMSGLIIIHLLLNYKMLISEIKILLKKR